MRIEGTAITLRGPAQTSIRCDDDYDTERPTIGAQVLVAALGALAAGLATKSADAIWERLFPKPSDDDSDDLTVEGLLGAMREAIAAELAPCVQRIDALEERIEELEKPRRKR